MSMAKLSREKSDDINKNRRRFLGMAAMTAAAAQLGVSGSLDAPASRASTSAATTSTPSKNTSFGPLKQIDAGVLSVGYAEAGPASGPAAILLHGWPYDIYSFVDVAPVLASAGYRVIVPYLRGYGTTRFLSSETVRNGQPSAVAVDTVALMDALKIQKAIVAGFDWGARTGDIMAVLWPERCKALVSVSGYLIGSQESGKLRCHQRRSCSRGTNIISRRNAAVPVMKNTATIFASSSGNWLRRNGTLTTPPSIAAQLLSTTWIMPRSSSTITAGALDWRKASRSMTIWKSALPKLQSSPYPPSPWKAMLMAHRIRILALTLRNSRASMRTGISRVAPGTICLKKPPRPLPKP
jgi:pimeloyl-ACP methyl ester carboxylesterase